MRSSERAPMLLVKTAVVALAVHVLAKVQQAAAAAAAAAKLMEN